MLPTSANFFEENLKERDVKSKQSMPNEETSLFECNAPGCSQVFKSFAEMETHLMPARMSQQQTKAFMTKSGKTGLLSFNPLMPHQPLSIHQPLPPVLQNNASIKLPFLVSRWALKKQLISARFSHNVKEYLTARFMVGEKTGRKSDPT